MVWSTLDSSLDLCVFMRPKMYNGKYRKYSEGLLKSIKWVKCVIEVYKVFFSSSRRDERADIPCWPKGRVGEALRPLLLKYIEGKQEVALLEGRKISMTDFSLSRGLSL